MGEKVDRRAFFEAERTIFLTLALSVLVNIFLAYQWTRTIGQREVARNEAKRWAVEEAACREREKMTAQVALVAFDFVAKCKDGSTARFQTMDYNPEDETE